MVFGLGIQWIQQRARGRRGAVMERGNTCTAGLSLTQAGGRDVHCEKRREKRRGRLHRRLLKTRSGELAEEKAGDGGGGGRLLEGISLFIF